MRREMHILSAQLGRTLRKPLSQASAR